ncbi:Crotonobetainyl-CoA reductase [Brevundimonas sp. NIBR10]|uniref:acyl-CoA dehydrogenase family protein n=1 Tax=Brevundimonas sp. NIBR10 TaxID=3015997 RepID=UPI0022F17E04|nr:acyl-CoA dehydrogenase family protein [Brevundimonas sp. NIBR10]WGM45931.1 Crotonobetainyl-CoA reductase [Brevundimonas sp. NIBR10]
MDFNHTEDRQMLADTLNRYLADRYPIERRNDAAFGPIGYSAGTWSDLAELGVIGALFDEASGGFGGQGFDLMVVFEALGRALVVEPFLGTLMAGRVLAGAGGRQDLLARVIAGEVLIAFAHEDARDADGLASVLTATPGDAGWSLTGAKGVVLHAGAADLLVVPAVLPGAAEPSLFLVPADAAGLTVRGYSLVDGGRAAEVGFDRVSVGPDALIAREGAALIAGATAAGLLALSAEALGAMETARAATVDYLQTRVQFGAPIGRFQALQHRMATVLLEIEQARSAVINAAAALEGPALARDRAASAAKYTVGRTGALVAEEAIQLHGGIGMTWELPLPHFAKRLIMIDQQLGDEDHHLARYARLGQGPVEGPGPDRP